MPKNKDDLSLSGIEIKPELLDEFFKHYQGPADFNILFKQLKKAIIERAMGAELTHHLGYAKGEEKPLAQRNHRNGTTAKTLLTEDGELPIEVPRDRDGSFEPQLIPKGERRFTGFDHKIIAMYARGMRCGRSRAISRKCTAFWCRPI